MPRIEIPNEWERYGFTEDEWWKLRGAKRWALRNPDKSKAATQAWKAKNKQYALTRHRKYALKKYNLTQDEYHAILRLQGRKCAICGTPNPKGRWRVFAVDHDHETGSVRGLLCNKCNQGLGYFDDSPELLQKAIEYLAKTQEERNARGGSGSSSD